MGRNWVGIVAGVVAGAALAVGAVIMLSSGQSEDSSKPDRKEESSPIHLPAGTEIELVLLKPLHSGDVRVGDTAALVVARDVKGSSGQVAIPAGHIAKLEVVRSREGSVMSSLVNQPARLEVRFLDIGVGGSRVRVVANLEDHEATLELTRATASQNEASRALIALWEHEETQAFLTGLAERFNGGDLGEDFDDPDSRRIFSDVAKELGLEATERLGANGETVDTLLQTTDRLARGGFEDIGATEAMLAIRAVTELGRVATSVDRGLRGAIKGRNIKIPIGTKLTVYVAKDVTIEP